MKLILTTMKKDSKAGLQKVAETSMTMPTIERALSFLKSYCYQVTGPNQWTKQVVTRAGVYTLNAELRTV